MKKILILLVLFACVAVYAQKKVTVHVAYSEVSGCQSFGRLLAES